jgi:RNA recognition motif-containing protein
MEQQQHKSCSLWVGNLHPSVTEGDLIKVFQRCSMPARIRYVWHQSGPRRGQPKGFAFVDYLDENDAKRARDGVNGYQLKGRSIVVRFQEGNSENQEFKYKGGPTSSLRPKRAREEISSDDLRDATKSNKFVKSLDDKIAKLQVIFPVLSSSVFLIVYC